MEMLVVLAVLVVLAIPVAVIVLLVSVSRLKERVATLERRVVVRAQSAEIAGLFLDARAGEGRPVACAGMERFGFVGLPNSGKSSLYNALAGGGALAANAHKSVTLSADGENLELGSWSGSVAGLLESQGVTLGEHDEVTPALDSPLREGEDVVVLRAQPIDVTVDGEAQTLWTTADSTGSAPGFTSPMATSVP